MNTFEKEVQETIDAVTKRVEETGDSEMCVIEVNGLQFYRVIKKKKVAEKVVEKVGKAKTSKKK